MFVILNTKYFDESICDSSVIGYFNTKEKAEDYLIDDGYIEYKVDNIFEEKDDDCFVFEKSTDNEYVSFTAHIQELKAIF